MYKHLVVLVVLAVLLSACGPARTTPVVAPPTDAASTPLVTAQASPSPVPPTITATIPTATITPTVAATNTAVPAVYGPDNFPAGIDPLTGLQVSDPSLLQRRPIAVKVNIIPAYNRPPWGLSFADIVYEYYHQTGDTRFHAIFYGQDADLVGPVRSGRLLDDSLIQMYKSIFVYGHADPDIDTFFENSTYSDRLVQEAWQDTPCPPTASIPLCRFSPQTYNFLLGGTKAIHEYEKAHNVNDSQQNLNGMVFSSAPVAGGQPGKQVTTYYSYNSYNRWEYDAASGLYLRGQDKVQKPNVPLEFEPLVDRLTEKQISAANILVVLAPHRNYNQPGRNQIVEINLSMSGEAYAFRDGQVYKVTWNRTATDSILYLTNPDGSRFAFKPGATWIEVVDTTPKITSPGDGTWRFDQSFH